ncbi:MAG: hypothetical protein KatS3mg131_0279 [Candidatus Tectimicrobiota bacterium]|nr:MAG: hypothetical protein KatS3mg131_0279 [Candidatus Tectomicrobia bacterium]
MRLTCLPPRVSQALRVRKPCFRHHLVLCWLLVLYILYGQRANLQALARYGPAHLAYQHYRRLLCAAYWCTKALRWWFAHQAMQALPPPQDGLLYLVVTAPSRASAGTSILWTPASAGILPPGFGFRVVFLMAQGGVYGAGVDVVLLCRKDDPGYQKCPVSADAAGFSPAVLVPRSHRGGRCRLVRHGTP